jgi:hypothetical protein
VKTLIEVASRRTFRVHTEFWPAVRPSNTRTIGAVYACLASFYNNIGICLTKVFVALLDEKQNV